MRTWFEPEEFSAAVDARHESRDGRPAYWDGARIRFFLLRYVPYKVTAPRKELDLAPEVLRTYLRYLDVTGLRDP
ncbi:hypothetical protein LDL08_32925 [Nonomuraea glycinis]|uniref:Uncharacterized protein n=1 Tax=Nonomuraea glycinis TaxID=2047744 RepID=A0A918E9D8_9ACTN|nr:hypothetical protein [Nonomuraea glycinis]MCA2180995.1 hypothetical protein [Nonomuraea glycinis]GGP13175.1 hypothetical protein GCM10012278_63910 [Nonomuraea glycinis]